MLIFWFHNSLQAKTDFTDVVLRECEINPWKNSGIQLGFKPKTDKFELTVSYSSFLFQQHQKLLTPIQIIAAGHMLFSTAKNAECWL